MEATPNQENNRDEQGRFIPGVSGNPNGRPIETEEQKLKKIATERVIETYIDDLSQFLPEIKSPLIEAAKKGDMSAIKEIHDRVLGKPKQSLDIKADVESKIIRTDE